MLNINNRLLQGFIGAGLFLGGGTILSNGPKGVDCAGPQFGGSEESYETGAVIAREVAGVVFTPISGQNVEDFMVEMSNNRPDRRSQARWFLLAAFSGSNCSPNGRGGGRRLRQDRVGEASRRFVNTPQGGASEVVGELSETDALWFEQQSIGDLNRVMDSLPGDQRSELFKVVLGIVMRNVRRAGYLASDRFHLWVRLRDLISGGGKSDPCGPDEGREPLIDKDKMTEVMRELGEILRKGF